jgi:hypothetical protein
MAFFNAPLAFAAPGDFCAIVAVFRLLQNDPSYHVA